MAEPRIMPSVKDEWMSRFKADGVLMEGEVVDYALGGAIEKSIDAFSGKQHKGTGIGLTERALKMDRRHGMAAITNLRLLFYMPKRMGRYEYDSYNLDEINNIEFTKGRGKGRVMVTTPNDHKVIKDVDNDEAKEFANIIQKIIFDKKSAADAPPPAAAAPAQSPVDVLKMKLVNGEITEEEYESKMKLIG